MEFNTLTEMLAQLKIAMINFIHEIIGEKICIEEIQFEENTKYY